jgi:carbonic anhydrase
MKNRGLFIFISGIFFLSYACTDKATYIPATAANDSSISVNKNDFINEGFLNKEAQSKLTPDFVLNTLKKGNLDYTSDNLVIRNTSERIRKGSLGQYPAAEG